jgi:hypothetical protein
MAAMKNLAAMKKQSAKPAAESNIGVISENVQLRIAAARVKKPLMAYQ